ncbi:hypothetical protein [Lacinutrix sp. Hel_I_90]|uniref:hypothetical protein n=1 Tax=Lacinutrix sp. Hel_I_90 TaxID=1249999 RepID=UPI0005C975AB|nr:hypothetical protein [Lacinutrix sp. Hel_I_90]
MKTLKLLTLLLILSYSCSSSDEEQTPTETPIVNKNVKNVKYPTSSNTNGMAGINTNLDFYYDNDQLSTIYNFPYTYGVNYINNNLIELDIIAEITSGDVTGKRSIHLNNNTVQFIIDEKTTSYTNSPSIEAKDSINYTYQNQYLSKVEFYSKSTGPFSNPDYRLNKKIEFTVENGNVVKTVSTGNFLIKTSIYTYDNKTNIKYSGFAIESPLNLGFDYILLHDKTGLSNQNNIISINNTFEGEIRREYETITYEYVLDSNERLSEIIISGTTIRTLPSPETTTFTNEKTEFIY